MPQPSRLAGKTSFVDRAYVELKERIVANTFPPGHQVIEADLARDLGMSRTPVREALVKLSHEGLIELIPRHGMRVLPLSIDDMREIYGALTCLETEAAELLALRRPNEHELADMVAAMEDMEAALVEHDLDRWALADERFHRALLENCGNRRIANMAFTMWDQVIRARMLTMRLLPLPHRSNEEHRALIEAVRKGDATAARNIHRRQRVRASQSITEALTRFHLSLI